MVGELELARSLVSLELMVVHFNDEYLLLYVLLDFKKLKFLIKAR